jgi:hypothetical protein
MLARGLRSNILQLGYWRAINSTVTKMVSIVEEAVAVHNPTALVMHLLDNSVFNALQEDGTSIPERNLNGKYHVDGELVVADKRSQEKLLKLCKPLFSSAAGRKLVVVIPLPRYVTAPCCQDEEQMPNRKKRSFLEETLAELEVFKMGLFSSNLRNARVMDPWIGLRHLSNEDIWGRDTVHPKEQWYDTMVEGVLITEAKIGGKHKPSEDLNNTKKMTRRDSEPMESAPRGSGTRGGSGGGQAGGSGRKGQGSLYCRGCVLCDDRILSRSLSTLSVESID